MIRSLIRRKIFITLLVITAAFIIAVFAIRLGYIEEWLAARLEAKLAEYGVRVEIGSLSTSLLHLSVEAHDVKFYVEDAVDPFATLKHLSMAVAVSDVLNFNGPAEIHLRSCIIDGLRARYTIDKQGRSNLDGLHRSRNLEQRFSLNYSSANVIIRDAEFFYVDRLHQLDGIARNVSLMLSPTTDDKQRLVAASRQSEFVYDGRAIKELDVALNAILREDGAKVESLTLHAPLLAANLNGELKSWRDFNYELEARADLKLREVGALLAPNRRFDGTAYFEGKVEGVGSDYKATGHLRSENLVMREVRITGFSLTALGAGKGEAATGHTDLTLHALEAAGFRVNHFSAIGDFIGNGEDFSWLGTMRAQSFINGGVSGTSLTIEGARLKGPLNDLARTKLNGQMQIGSIVAADVMIGSLIGELTATADTVEMPNFIGNFFGGEAKGRARLRFDGRSQSEIAADFTNLDLDQSLAAIAGKRLPLRGKAEGKIDLRWSDRDYHSAEGAIHIRFAGGAAHPESEIAVNGTLNLIAANRVLRLTETSVHTGATEVRLSGMLGWDRTGSLEADIKASDAAELQRLIVDFTEAFDNDRARLFVSNLQKYQIQLSRGLQFSGRVSGALNNPRIQGRLALDSINVRGEPIGQLAGDLDYLDHVLRIERGHLKQASGGEADFNLDYPFNIENGIALRARLDRITIEPLLRPFTNQPIIGEVTGTIGLRGLPAAMSGQAEFSVNEAKYNDQPFEELQVRLAFDETRIKVQDIRFRFDHSIVAGTGWFDTKTKGYRVNLRGDELDVAELIKASGAHRINLTGKADVMIEAESDRFDRGSHVFDHITATLNSRDLRYDDQPLGAVQLSVNGKDSVAQLEFQADLLERHYTGMGKIDFTERNAPASGRIELQDVALAPIFDLVTEKAFSMPGTVTGELRLAGNLFGEESPLRLEAELSTLTFESNGARLAAQPPVIIKLQNNQIDFGRVRFSGPETSLELAGTLATSKGGKMALTANGDVDLRLMQNFIRGVSADGIVHLQLTASGSYEKPRLSGSATLEKGALRSREYPLALSKGHGKLLFTADQAQIESFTGEVGGGQFSLTGGAALVGLVPDRWRVAARLNGIRVDYPHDVRTTADGNLILQGNRRVQVLSGQVKVRRAEYLTGGDLFDLTERVLAEFSGTTGGDRGIASNLPPTQLDLSVVANDSLIITNNSLDLVASADLHVIGTIDDPLVKGRLTISRGLISDFFREPYRITSGVVEFPGISERPPRLSIEAEAVISGYQVSMLIAGPLDKLRITPRSEPPLPQVDLVTLMTTGQLPRDGVSDTSPTQALAQTQATNLATLLTQPLSSRIGSNVTGRLFGLNRFSIDPLITGRGTDPTARITVGRRITKDLSITYSTNLASNQDQVLLIEYRVSDRLSFVASRTSEGAFGLDVRLRKRF